MILDHIDKLSFSDEVNQHLYAKSALDRLAEGLFWIYREIAEKEKYAKNRAKKDEIQISLGGENIGNPPLGRISCSFQWYAISATNYAQLVGWLAYRDKKQAKEYVNRIMPNISQYRNKVAAHFSITDPYKDDSEGSLITGLLTNIVYAKGHFYAGALSPNTLDGKEVDPSNILSWSITQAHQHLAQRFWPEGKPTSYNAVMLPAHESMTIKVNYDAGP